MNRLWGWQLRLFHILSQQARLVSFPSHGKPLPRLSWLSLFLIGHPTSNQTVTVVQAELSHLLRCLVKMLFICLIFDLVSYFKQIGSISIREAQLLFFRCEPKSTILLSGSLHAIDPICHLILACGRLVKILLVIDLASVWWSDPPL